MARNATPADPNAHTGRRIQTRRSGVPMAGSFCPSRTSPLAKCWWNTPAKSSAGRRRKTATPRPQPAQPHVLLPWDEDRVIDANYGGNSARWINHSCDPNCFCR